MPTPGSAARTARASRSSRGTRTRLTREAILDAGLELAMRVGATSVSVRDLGSQLGTDPTAIYRHFRNKDELMQALLDELNARSVAAVSAPLEDWRGRLRELAIATLDEYARHPAVAVEAVVLTTHGPGERDAIELMLDAFSRAGLSDEEIVRHYALLASHVLSVAAGIARSRGEHSLDALESSPWFEGPVLTDPRTHPLITKFGPRIAGLGDRELFILGVDAVIESAERISAEQSAG